MEVQVTIQIPESIKKMQEHTSLSDNEFKALFQRFINDLLEEPYDSMHIAFIDWLFRTKSN